MIPKQQLKKKSPIKSFGGKVRQRRLSGITYQLFDLTRRETDFISLIAILITIAAFVTPYPQYAMWFGFALASYSAIANDSIQTIGTFIASNTERKWWYLWLFMGSIFIITILYSWIQNTGDVSYQRLSEKGFSEAPKTFSFWQLCTPVALLILTRMRIPVSTTFLLLNIFATNSGAILNVLQKSLYGYIIAFSTAISIWYLISKFVNKHFQGKPGFIWTVLQWISSGLLWSVWIMQDAANLAVFLPRQLDLVELIIFVSLIFLGLGGLFYLKGDRMQQLVDEKEGIKDIRAATLVDAVYMTILFYFKNVNNIPISTTWVFIGLLGGRELAISLNKTNPLRRKKAIRKSIKFIRKDLKHACIGLAISIILAILVNPTIKMSIQQLLW